jgi:hypothetical protein
MLIGRPEPRLVIADQGLKIENPIEMANLSANLRDFIPVGFGQNEAEASTGWLTFIEADGLAWFNY